LWIFFMLLNTLCNRIKKNVWYFRSHSFVKKSFWHFSHWLILWYLSHWNSLVERGISSCSLFTPAGFVNVSRHFIKNNQDQDLSSPTYLNICYVMKHYMQIKKDMWYFRKVLYYTVYQNKNPLHVINELVMKDITVWYDFF